MAWSCSTGLPMRKAGLTVDRSAVHLPSQRTPLFLVILCCSTWKSQSASCPIGALEWHATGRGLSWSSYYTGPTPIISTKFTQSRANTIVPHSFYRRMPQGLISNPTFEALVDREPCDCRKVRLGDAAFIETCFAGDLWLRLRPNTPLTADNMVRDCLVRCLTYRLQAAPFARNADRGPVQHQRASAPRRRVGHASRRRPSPVRSMLTMSSVRDPAPPRGVRNGC
jgi:hypothetical protein